MSESKYVLLMTTVAKRADAQRLARMAVNQRLAACVQIIPKVVSVYRWKGKIERANEWLVLFKTSKKALPALMKAIKATHPYSLPELAAVSISAGSREYLNWIDAETRPNRKSKIANRK